MTSRHFGPPGAAVRPVPRGIAKHGPAILAYGFRPFFLLAGLFAAIAMPLWIGALLGGWKVGGSAGPLQWHAHEMLFGYATAALGGFILTAVPNWTGRLPVSGMPLLALVGLWLAGRVAMLAPDVLGSEVTGVIDGSFLPALAFVVGREVVAGKNWKNLRVLFGIGALATANLGFHFGAPFGLEAPTVLRLAVGLYVVLIAHIGGRIVPSFTRNYLVKAAAARLPRPFGRLDSAALLATVLAMGYWSVVPEGWLTALLCAAAALLQAIRLARWRGEATLREPLLAVLHIGYGFVPIGQAALALAALGLLAPAAALHLLTVGAIGLMTLGVMTRASRGHTGRAMSASRTTTAAYAALLAAALLRPVADLFPDLFEAALAISALCWIAAFLLFITEYAPILLSPSAREARR